MLAGLGLRPGGLAFGEWTRLLGREWQRPENAEGGRRSDAEGGVLWGA